MSKTYVFLGDSTTDANRLWLPEFHGLGNGYVSILASSIRQKDPDAKIINKGFDGFTLPFLFKNLERDCLKWHPDNIVILIGINDVGIAMNTGVTLKEQKFFSLYERLLDEIITWSDASILLLTPFIFPHPAEYASWIPSVREAETMICHCAASFHVPVLTLHDRFHHFALELGMDAVTTDGIHLTQAGHQFLADLIAPYL